MANKLATSLSQQLISHLNYLEKTRSRMEELLSKGSIVRRDIEQVYEGLWLDATTSFESFIEHLFISLLVNRIRFSSTKIFPRTIFSSDLIARQIVFSGKHFADWLPYGKTEQRAEIFFRKGFPFTCLSKDETKFIQEAVYIRNAIAHNSKYSRNKFEEEVIGSLNLLPIEKTPAGFLRSIFRITPTQTRYENYAIELGAVATKICTFH